MNNDLMAHMEHNPKKEQFVPHTAHQKVLFLAAVSGLQNITKGEGGQIASFGP